MDWLRTGPAGLLVVLFSLVFAGCGPDPLDPALLGSWSPDGSKAVLVPDPFAEPEPEPGMWLYDAASDTTRKIVSPQEGEACLHPHWSPFSDEILFAVVPKDDQSGGRIPYSVWVVHSDGHGLKKLLESAVPEDLVDAFLQPNAITWGALPGTVIFQQAADDEHVRAVVFDPYTGRETALLPYAAEGYSLQPSPCRRRLAAILYEQDARTGRVIVSDFGHGNWQTLGFIRADTDLLGKYSPMIFWNEDSSGFSVPDPDDPDHLRGFAVAE